MQGAKLAGFDNTAVHVRRAFERVFAAGDTIFEEGDRGEVLYVIQSGGVELSRRTRNGRHAVAKLGPGEFFGEMCVVLGEPRTACATATGQSRLLELDRETLETMCIERPEIAIRIIRRLSARLIDSERRLAALDVDDLRRPMVRALLKKAEPRTQDGVCFPGQLQDHAREAGLGMLEAHHVLHQLLDQKILKLVDDGLVAEDLDSLAACLDEDGMSAA